MVVPGVGETADPGDGETVVAGVAPATRMVSPALPITMAPKISLSGGEKRYLAPATITETMIKAAHILLNAIELTLLSFGPGRSRLLRLKIALKWLPSRPKNIRKTGF